MFLYSDFNYWLIFLILINKVIFIKAPHILILIYIVKYWPVNWKQSVLSLMRTIVILAI